jgi:hypothetical protein
MSILRVRDNQGNVHEIPCLQGPAGISATHSWDGTTLTIVSASGTSSSDLKGEPGKTPVRGTDYWTDADKVEIQNYVDESLITDETLIRVDGVLKVNTTSTAEADNTRPITSAGVHAQIGNIAALLETI